MRGRPERAESRPIVATTACIGLVSLVVSAGNVPLLYAVVLPTIVPPLTALIIWAVASGTRGGTWLGWRPLRLVGRRAYALYLWHYFCLALAWQLPLPGVVQAVLGLALAWALATVSWHAVERPFLRRRASVSET